MKVEPRATVISFEDADFGNMRIQTIKTSTVFQELIANGTELTTVADVLAAPREPNVAMSSAGAKIFSATPSAYQMNQATAIYHAMLDQFEKANSA